MRQKACTSQIILLVLLPYLSFTLSTFATIGRGRGFPHVYTTSSIAVDESPWLHPHSVQVVSSCSHDLAAAVRQYERQRLPDVHALYRLDLSAQARAGAQGTPWWNLDYLGAKFHVLLALLLQKVVPQRFKGPEIMRMWSERMPFQEVASRVPSDFIYHTFCAISLCKYE